MTTPSVDELFKQALALDDAKREEFFASLDDGVRKELASLLTADGKAECRRFLNRRFVTT